LPHPIKITGAMMVALVLQLTPFHSFNTGYLKIYRFNLAQPFVYISKMKIKTPASFLQSACCGQPPHSSNPVILLPIISPPVSTTAKAGPKSIRNTGISTTIKYTNGIGT
jgi:hypothetical protein